MQKAPGGGRVTRQILLDGVWSLEGRVVRLCVCFFTLVAVRLV